MNLTYYPFKPIIINTTKPTLLETCNQEVYTDLVSGLKGYTDSIKISDDEFKLVENEKAVKWIGDAFVEADLNKMFQSQLQKQIATKLDDETRMKLTEINNQLKSLIFDATFSLDLPLKVDSEFDPAKLVKYCDVGFVSALNRDPYGIIETVLKTASELKESKILVLTGVRNYLSVSQFNELVRLISTLDLNTLFIEFSEIDNHEEFDECRYYYVDQDFVDWRY
ncbi:type II-A CRISPR-associated protein Csn2 [Pediococcus inopinatus]|uniref:type II-A CRISPR-associated protein Csn2 n=1 Tax=Pediococcus inopinatus TaxID=114090 RepID=UPI00070D37ED|nr:type II-A CRISPR-associated protein Csn2 [Pediococcus inopinatus]AVL00697.1 type II-A CRISPR-associated protein Csn2 [Pediococcus inopinatus]KRN61541.1 CRISPR-associated Csn2 family protein [Pediococcus inopinatus]